MEIQQWRYQSRFMVFAIGRFIFIHAVEENIYEPRWEIKSQENTMENGGLGKVGRNCLSFSLFHRTTK